MPPVFHFWPLWPRYGYFLIDGQVCYHQISTKRQYLGHNAITYIHIMFKMSKNGKNEGTLKFWENKITTSRNLHASDDQLRRKTIYYSSQNWAENIRRGWCWHPLNFSNKVISLFLTPPYNTTQFFKLCLSIDWQAGVIPWQLQIFTGEGGGKETSKISVKNREDYGLEGEKLIIILRRLY